MKIFQFLFVLSFIGLISSCGDSAAAKAKKEKAEENIKAQEKKWDQVMAIHDEVMPLMGEINQYVRNLKSNISDGKIPEEMKESTFQIIERLEAADEGMFSWMENVRQIEPLRDSLSHPEIMEYLQKEMIAVTKVKVDIVTSIDQGKALINTLTEQAQNK